MACSHIPASDVIFAPLEAAPLTRLALPTKVGETQEREGLWFSLSTLLPVSSGEPPELD